MSLQEPYFRVGSCGRSLFRFGIFLCRHRWRRVERKGAWSTSPRVGRHWLISRDHKEHNLCESGLRWAASRPTPCGAPQVASRGLKQWWPASGEPQPSPPRLRVVKIKGRRSLPRRERCARRQSRRIPHRQETRWLDRLIAETKTAFFFLLLLNTTVINRRQRL